MGLEYGKGNYFGLKVDEGGEQYQGKLGFF